MKAGKEIITVFLLSALLVALIYFAKQEKPKATKIYWFIPDGLRADPDIFTIYKWAQEGKLPNIKKMMELCKNDKNRPPISNVYMAGVSYKALIDIGEKKTQREIAEVAGVTESMLRKHFHKYYDRNNIFLPDLGIGIISSDLIPIQEEFRKILGYKPHLVKIKLGSPAFRDYKMLADIVGFLLNTKHFAKNPISEYELERQLTHEYDFRDVSLYSLLNREISPVRRDSTESDVEEYCIKDKKKAEKWLKVMDKLIQTCKASS